MHVYMMHVGQGKRNHRQGACKPELHKQVGFKETNSSPRKGTSHELELNVCD